MKIIDCEQGKEEWFDVRRGIPSASNFSKIITATGKPSTQAEKYLFKLAGEKVSGITEDTYQNAAMLRGIEMEEEARQLYQIMEDVKVEQVGFCISEGYGCSPDGLVGDKGMLEIKCPNVATHVSYLLKGTLPSDYFQQVQGQLLVTGREWCDFMSYSTCIKPFIIRVDRDEKFLASLKVELKLCCMNLEEIISKIQ